MLFTEKITNLQEWSEIFQNKAAFTPLAQEIFARCGLPFSGLESCAPGSNAVFGAGKYIVKIFSPVQAQLGGAEEFVAEKYGLERAARLGVPAPRVMASGVLEDRYVFRWMVLERVKGDLLAHAVPGLSDGDWFELGAQLRQAVERLDAPCADFYGKALGNADSEARWMLFSQAFRKERQTLLAGWQPQPVFVHGDLNADNLMVAKDGRLVLIDFADCRTAPFETELAALVCDGFRFPAAYLRGFLEEYDRAQMAKALLRGLLLHDYGAWIIRDQIGTPDTFQSLDALERSLLCCLNR